MAASDHRRDAGRVRGGGAARRLRAALDERIGGMLDRIAPYVALERRTSREELRAFAKALLRPELTGSDDSKGGCPMVKLIGSRSLLSELIALVYQGITYTSKEKIIDVGPLKAEVDRKKTIPLSPVLGIVALVGGVALLLVAGRRSSGRSPGRAGAAARPGVRPRACWPRRARRPCSTRPASGS